MYRREGEKMICKKCSATIPDDAKFCPACGTAVCEHQSDEQNKTKYCPASNPEAQENNIFLNHETQASTQSESASHTKRTPFKRQNMWKITLGAALILLMICFKPICGLVGLFTMVAIPFSLIAFIISIFRKKPKKKWGIACLISVFLFVIADSSLHVDDRANDLSVYTYDEYIMYCTMLNGYEKILSNLKNPNADFLGISYDPDSNIAYFCVLAENDFGGRTKSYISCNRNSVIDESDYLKYYYDSCEIKRTMADLQLFVNAVENSDESDVPVNNSQERLSNYSLNDQKMYEMFIRGIDAVELLYDNVVILGYKYDTLQNSAYFYFTGEEIGTGKTVLTYANYTNYYDLYVSDSYKYFFDDADIEVFFKDIADYRLAIKKDISKATPHKW